jgi:hypothetical protein
VSKAAASPRATARRRKDFIGASLIETVVGKPKKYFSGLPMALSYHRNGPNAKKRQGKRHGKIPKSNTLYNKG